MARGPVHTGDINTQGSLFGLGPGPYDGGAVELISGFQDVTTGNITTSGGSVASADPAGKGGNVAIGANTFALIQGNLTTAGGNNMGTGNGGNGGLFNVTIPSQNNFVTVTGLVDSRGGNATGGGNGGDGGNVTLVANVANFGGPPLTSGGTGTTNGADGQVLVIDPALLPAIIDFLNQLQALQLPAGARVLEATAGRSSSTIIATDQNFEQRRAKLNYRNVDDGKEEGDAKVAFASRIKPGGKQDTGDLVLDKNAVLVLTGEVSMSSVKDALSGRLVGEGTGRAARGVDALADTTSMLFKVTGGRGDLVLFSVAGQVFSGNLGDSHDVVAVGTPGTTITKDNGMAVLHCGRLFADTGKEPLTFQTRTGAVIIPQQSAAVIDAQPGKPVRVTAVVSDLDEPVTLRGGAGDTEPIALKPGQQAIVSDHDLSDEELIAVDGQGNKIVGGGIHLINKRTATVDLPEDTVGREIMVAGRAIRIGGINRTLASRVARHTSPPPAEAKGVQRFVQLASQMTAKAQAAAQSAAQKAGQAAAQLTSQAASQVAVQPQSQGAEQLAAATAASRAREPMHLLATDDSSFLREPNGDLVLGRGNFFLRLPGSLKLKTAHAEIEGLPGSMVSVDHGQGYARIKALSGPGHVTVKVGGRPTALSVGEEMFVADHRPADAEMVPQDGVGRRALRAYSAGDSATAVVSEFSMISFLKNSGQMLAVRRGTDQSNRQILASLLKTAAALHMTAGHKGRYFARQDSGDISLNTLPWSQMLAQAPAASAGQR